MIFVSSTMTLSFDVPLSLVKTEKGFKKLWPELELFGRLHRDKLFRLTISVEPNITLSVSLYAHRGWTEAMVSLDYRGIELSYPVLDLYELFQIVRQRIEVEFELNKPQLAEEK